MDYRLYLDLEDKTFKNITDKAILLMEYGIDTFIKYDNLYFNNAEDYLKSIYILNDHNSINEKDFKKGIINGYTVLYETQRIEESKHEFYSLDKTDNKVALYRNDKKKYIVIQKEKDNNYKLFAADENKDSKILSQRNIVFTIRTNSPLYRVLDNYCQSDNTEIFLEDNKNSMKIEKQNSTILLSINKVKDNPANINSEIAIISSKNVNPLLEELYNTIKEYNPWKIRRTERELSFRARRKLKQKEEKLLLHQRKCRYGRKKKLETPRRKKINSRKKELVLSKQRRGKFNMQYRK